MHELGWNDGRFALCGFVEPFDTWADMRHLIATRDVAASAARPGVLLQRAPRRGLRRRATATASPARASACGENAVRFLNHDVRTLAARDARPGEFRWDLLLDPDGASPERRGEARFASQFWSANVNRHRSATRCRCRAARAYRISPLDRTYDNLDIAGDWTDCGFNAGCVEAAVMSGRLAAHAIAQSPPARGHRGLRPPMRRTLIVSKERISDAAGRTQPIRNLSTLFAPGRAAPRTATAPTNRPATGRACASFGEAVSRSVELGYRVVDDYIQQGQRAAQRLNDRSSPRDDHRDVQSSAPAWRSTRRTSSASGSRCSSWRPRAARAADRNDAKRRGRRRRSQPRRLRRAAPREPSADGPACASR
jgi:hypothetical protein